MEQDKTQDTAQEQQGGATFTVADMLRELRELRETMASNSAYYVPSPTEALMSKAEAYFGLYCDDIKRLLASSGIDDETANAVLVDYVAILSGLPNVRLPLAKQRDLINTVKPWRIYLTERYGLNQLFAIYLYNVRACKDYIEQFKLADGHVYKVTHRKENGKMRVTREKMTVSVEEQKNNFLDTRTNRIASGSAPLYALGYQWIRINKVEQDGQLLDIVETSDFAGIEPERVAKFFAFVTSFAGIDNYVNYYYLAKYAFKATPDELKEILTPPVFKDAETAQAYAEQISLNRYQNLLNKAADVDKALAAETEKEREQARQEVITEPVAEPEPANETVKVSENIALLGSRDVWASTNGANIVEQGVIPISKVIAIYGQKHDLPNGVTPRVIEKAIQGLNMLQRFNHDAPVDGFYHYETNITEFCELCGYKQANGEEMKAVLTALFILRDLYLIVWKPKGREAINLLVMPNIGVEGEIKGRIKLYVSADALRGHQNFIQIDEIRKLQKDTKGQAREHFNYQLIAKNQKEEQALLNEVFGYDTMLFEATGYTGDERTNPDEVQNVKEYIRKHKTRDKTRLQKWFDECIQNRFLTSWSRTKNPKGEYIYKWRRANVKKDGEPDEQ